MLSLTNEMTNEKKEEAWKKKKDRKKKITEEVTMPGVAKRMTDEVRQKWRKLSVRSICKTGGKFLVVSKLVSSSVSEAISKMLFLQKRDFLYSLRSRISLEDASGP